MARGRMIAKTLSTSEKRAALHTVAGKLAEFCQALYPLLIAHADDWGCLQGDAFTVKYLVDPTSPRRIDEFETALKALHNVRLITWYDVEGKKYIFVCGWYAYQQLKGHDKDGRNRPIPAPPENVSEFEISAQVRPGSPKVALTELNLTEGKGRELKVVSDQAPLLVAASSEPDRIAPKGHVEAFVQLWNETTTPPLARCSGLSETRKTHIRVRLRERDFEAWRAVFQRIERSSFCRGHNQRTWVASFDWIIESPDNALKVLEGKYDDRGSPATRAGPDALSDMLETTRRKYLNSSADDAHEPTQGRTG